MASLNPPECRICQTCQLPLAQNTTSNRHGCPFCGRTFQRVDGARRHAKACPSRGDRPLPPEAKRGRKVHACDGCSQIKLLCDGKTPCARCASRSLTCTYGRLCAEPTHHRGENPSKASRHPALSFLLGCADPYSGPVGEVILDGEPGPEHSRAAPATQESSQAHAMLSDTIDPRLLFLGYVDPSFDAALDHESMNCGHRQDALDRLHLDTSDDELKARVSLLAVDLQQIAAGMPNFETFPSLGSFHAFFKVTNFRDCIAAFFHRGHLLASIIHLPTLHLGLVDPTLLLAIALSGSTYLHYRKEKQSPLSTAFTLAMHELAEKYIFHRVKQSLCSTSQAAGSRVALELCQAAYLIETLQMFVKDPAVRRRIINKRHPSLVALLRNLDVMGSTHGTTIVPQLERDWRLFVDRESWIRLVTWTFINDAWLILFSNHPPAMTLSDMRGHLPCSDALWHTDNAATYEHLRSEQEFSSTLQCLRALIQGLLNEECIESTAVDFAHLDVQHLHVVVLAFQHLTYHHHTTLPLPSTSRLLLLGLSRWTVLWDAAMARLDGEEQRWLGVVKYSAGLAFIAKRMVEVGLSGEGRCEGYLMRAVAYDTGALHAFITRFCVDGW